MRILHITRGLEVHLGGPPRAISSLTSALHRSGVASTVFAPASASAYTGALVPLPDADLQLFPAGRLARVWPGHAPELARALKRNKTAYDLVHIHELWHHPHFVAVRVCKKLGIPYVITPHGTVSDTALSKSEWRKRLYTRLFQRAAIRGANIVHALTTTEADDVNRYATNVPTAVIPWGIDSTEFDPSRDGADFERSYPATEGKRVVLFMGRLNAVKGIDILVGGFARAARSRDDLHLVIAGPDDGYEVATRALVHEEGLDGRVSITGAIDGEVRLAALARADLFVLPSRGEGFSVAVLEALAASIPVVISDRCNFPDVARARAGREVAADPEAVGAAIGEILDDSALRREMARNGRALATGPYAWDTIATSFVEMYENVAKARISALI